MDEAGKAVCDGGRESLNGLCQVCGAREDESCRREQSAAPKDRVIPDYMRELWKTAKAAIIAAETEAAKITRPANETFGAVEEAICQILGQTGFEHLGNCTACSEPVFDCDTGFASIATGYEADGEVWIDGEIIYCRDCAPNPAQGIEAGTADTVADGIGAQHESPVAAGDASNISQES